MFVDSRISAEMLKKLPLALRSEIVAITQLLDFNATEEKITEVRSIDAEVTDGLLVLTQNYDLERMLNLLQTVDDTE